MNQRLIYVMGPSGAGKDSLLDWLKTGFAAFRSEGMWLPWRRPAVVRVMPAPEPVGSPTAPSVAPIEPTTPPSPGPDLPEE